MHFLVILLDLFPIKYFPTVRDFENSQDMAEDRGGKRKGVNGGGSGGGGGGRILFQPEHRQLDSLLLDNEGPEREHKSNKRLHTERSCRGGQWGWDQLSPMAQQAFTTNIVEPRMTYLNGVEPPPLELARLAPIHWGDLGIPFNMAYSKKQEAFEARAWGIKSDIALHPERDGNDPANDPCEGCEHMVCVCGELLDWDE